MELPNEMEDNSSVRLSYNQLEAIKRKYGVDRIWSFSRINLWDSCEWAYYYNYTKHMRLDTGNIYSFMGGKAHDLIEKFYDQGLSLENMKEKWNSIINAWEDDPQAFEFDTDKIRNGYIKNLNHYFSHTDRIMANNVRNEKPVMIRLGNDGEVFVGYIDSEYIDGDGNLVMVDYKTSSKSSFSKAKLPEKSMQLILYAIGEHQRTGLPYDKIKARFDMMKYCTVHYLQENGKWRESVQERSKWVEKMGKKLTTKLKKIGVELDEIDVMVQLAGMKNSMAGIPEEVSSQFYITNYYIDLKIDDEAVKDVEEKVLSRCQTIREFESLDEDDQITYMQINSPYNPDDYFEKKLCSYHTSDLFKEQEGLLINSTDLTSKVDSVISDMFSEDDGEESGVMARLFSA